MAPRDDLNVHNHLLMDVRVTHDCAELLETDLAVLILVGKEYSLVNDLLQLRVLQVVADHHLQYLKKATTSVLATAQQTQKNVHSLR